jgi:hypothetical protein
MPLTYERAFGGADTRDPAPENHRHETRNLVGVGLVGRESPEIGGLPLPNLEHPNHPLDSCTARPPPTGFGFISRGWQPRASYAGTYDDRWKQERFPFLPEDFDDLYFQGVPEEQRCAYLNGGETVVLINMTPAGRLQFDVPKLPVSMHLVFRAGHVTLQPRLDTLIVEPDAGRCILIWRDSWPLTRKLTDIYEVWVGVPSKGRLRAMQGEKRYVNWTSVA